MVRRMIIMRISEHTTPPPKVELVSAIGNPWGTLTEELREYVIPAVGFFLKP
jgi:hypothetical protein